MQLDKLFHVLVVTGAAATVGITGCGDDDDAADTGDASATGGSAPDGDASTTGGASSSGGASSTGGASTTGGASSSGGASATGGAATDAGTGGAMSSEAGSDAADADACEAVCEPNTDTPENPWTNCNGCCCWLAPGMNSPFDTPICGEEPCCEGRGR